MKQILLTGLLLVLLMGCSDRPATQSDNAVDSSKVQTSNPDSQSTKARSRKDLMELPDSAKPGDGLIGLQDMTLEQGMAIDGFRGRLEHDWGDVHSILMASGASFEPSGDDYLVIKGEIKQGGFPWGAIMILDLKQDAVFAAQYDGENKRFDQFEEEKEGLGQPKPLTEWMKQYR